MIYCCFKPCFRSSRFQAGNKALNHWWRRTTPPCTYFSFAHYSQFKAKGCPSISVWRSQSSRHTYTTMEWEALTQKVAQRLQNKEPGLSWNTPPPPPTRTRTYARAWAHSIHSHSLPVKCLWMSRKGLGETNEEVQARPSSITLSQHARKTKQMQRTALLSCRNIN